jgi:hypothetical protein
MNEAEYITPTTWEQCARHVEAGGIVEVQTAWGAWEREYLTPRTYRRRHGAPGGSAWVTRRLVPIESAAPAPESSTGIGEGKAVRAYYRPMTAERLRAISEAIVRNVGAMRWAEVVRADLLGWADMIEAQVVGDACREAQARRGTTPAPPPVPPWPGAVLSGLCDEDGVPTWLAQAGQVRGEQVRSWHGSGWVAATHSRYAWVEVRAPRPVPVPETERVQLGVAVVGGLLAICREGGTLDLGRGDVRIHTENGALVASTSESMFTVEIDPDGTIEVLKDGDR